MNEITTTMPRVTDIDVVINMDAYHNWGNGIDVEHFNACYSTALISELESAYPDADVSVRITMSDIPYRSGISVTVDDYDDDEYGELEAETVGDVNAIADRVLCVQSSDIPAWWAVTVENLTGMDDDEWEESSELSVWCVCAPTGMTTQNPNVIALYMYRYDAVKHAAHELKCGVLGVFVQRRIVFTVAQYRPDYAG
jgi:hypothetical protein